MLVCLTVAGATPGAAVRAEESAGANPDERAVRAAANDYVAAMRRGDAESLKTMWTADGDYVDAAGQVYKAHDLTRDQIAPSRHDADSVDAAVSKSSLRFITPDVAIEDGATDCGVSGDGSMLTGRFTAVWVKRDGRWLLDSLREAVASSPTPNDHLQPLSWLLGEWVGSTDDFEILVSSRWSDGGNYIVREFIVRSDGREPVSGTQRIGWDPAAGKIKSWTFDSQGGSGEGYWRRDGERWLVESVEVMADGKKSTTSAVYAPGDEGRFVWEAGKANVAGKSLPTVRVEFKRAVEDE